MGKQLSNLDFNSQAKIVNLPNPTNAQDAATKSYVDSAVEGISWKDAVRAASTANINFASLPSTIDGITMVNGDRFLAKDQSTGSQNGIYIWSSIGGAATRSADASTGAELEQAVVVVEEGGSNGGTSWRQTAVNFTIDSGSNAWTAFISGGAAASESTAGIAEIATQSEVNTGSDDTRFITPLKLANYSAKKLKAVGTIGDGSNTQIDVTHNLGSRDLIVQLRTTASPYDLVMCDIEALDNNTTRFKFAAAPTSAQYSYVILG
jgi:hypothetical protein